MIKLSTIWEEIISCKEILIKGQMEALKTSSVMFLLFKLNRMWHLYLSKKCLWGNFVVCYWIAMSGQHPLLNSLKN